MISVDVGGVIISQVSKMELSRDLQDITGTFSLAVVDQKRVIAAYEDMSPDVDGYPALFRPGPPVTIKIDDEVVLTGWLEKVHGTSTARAISFTLAGRDKAGDLVESTALPEGPLEFRNITLLAFVQKICAPFGIPVRADVDLGEPFERLSLNPHETAMASIDKAARQRSVLVVSDGVGGLILTRGGATRGPDSIRMGDNAFACEFDLDHSHRFSDYYVRGQTDSARQRKGVPAKLDSTVQPLTSDGTAVAPPRTVTASPISASNAERQAIIMSGHAIDPEITRYRPTVRLTRTQSGMSSVQEQAEWALRVAKGRSDAVRYSVLGWRAGPGKALWRPNQVVAVSDPIAGIDADRLIAGVRYTFDEKGENTQLRVVDLTAYDRVNEAAKRRHRTERKKAKGPLRQLGHTLHVVGAMKEVVFDGRMSIAKGIVVAVHDDGQAQTVDVVTHDGATYAGIEVCQGFGFASVPPADGALAMLFAVGDDPANRMAWLYNPATRMGKLAPGESTMYGEDGSRVDIKDGTVSVLGMEHVVLKSPDVLIVAPNGATIQGNTKIIGDLDVTGDINDKNSVHGSLDNLRTQYNRHRHTELGIGGLTSTTDSPVA